MASACALALLLLSCGASAQQYVFDTYQQERGLSNLSTKDVTFDKSGFLWVATENGLFRFLGSHFERFGAEQGLAERDVTRIYIDPRGRVWAGTSGNLYRWDGYRFAPAFSKPLPIYGTETMEAESPTKMLVQSKHRLVELTLDANENVIEAKPYFSEDERRHERNLDRIMSHVRAPDGTLWLGCTGKLYSYRDGKLKAWDEAAGVPAELWYTLHRDRSGAIWALSQKHAIVAAAGASRFEDRTPPDADPGAVFRTLPIVEDRDGRMLVDSASGLSRWDGRTWQTIGPANGLTTSHVTCMALGRDGDVWMGSIADGLTHWTGYEHWEAWTERQGLPSSVVWSFASSRGGRIAIGTSKGPGYVDERASRIELPGGGDKWPYGQVSGIVEGRDGVTWMATFAGWVLRVDPHAHPSVRPILQSTKFIYGLVAGADGRMWLATDAGVDEVVATANGGSILHVDAVDAMLKSNPNASSPYLCLRRGKSLGDGSATLWLMSQGSGLIGYAAGSWAKAAISGDSIDEAAVEDMSLAADGSLWLYGQDKTVHGTVWHLVPEGLGTSRAWHATRIAMPAGVRELLVESILVDRRGWVWLGTDTGLDAWNGSEWRHVSRESGLVWNDTDRGVLFEESDGTIWIGTSGGAAHLLHPETIFDEPPLSVQITAMRRGESTLAPEGSNRLPYAGLPILFGFATPDLRNRSDLIFRYRIGGAKSDWIATEDTQAAFTALSPGERHFEVLAYNRNTGERSPVTEAGFVILPPWWETLWFYGVCVLAGFAVLWLFTRLRTRHLVLQQQKLEGLIEERTFELKRSQEELRTLAMHDALTGLLNRGAIFDRLGREMNRAFREDTPIAVLLIDLDHFKQINDTHGHLAGDEVLRRFGVRLEQIVRPYDHAGRYGGEEFLLVLGNLPEEIASRRLQSLHAEVTDMAVPYEGTDLTVTCSIGAVILIHQGEPIDTAEVLARADRALYEAKRAGRNRIVFADATELPL